MAEQLTLEQIAQQLADLKASNEKLTKDNQTISAQNQRQLADLKAANEKLAQDNQTISAQNQQQLADLKATNEKLTKDNQTISTENQKLIKTLNTKLPDTETVIVKMEDPKLPTQRVKVGEAEYAFQVPVFYHGGFYHTAEELVADQKSESAQKIVAELLKIQGQGILKEVK